MSYHVQVSQVGRSGAPIGTKALFEAETKDEAVALAQIELRRAPAASSRLMYRIYDPAHRMVLSYITPAGKRAL